MNTTYVEAPNPGCNLSLWHKL